MVTVIDVLENAEFNITQGIKREIPHFIQYGLEQLQRALKEIRDNDKGLYQEIASENNVNP